MLTLRSALLILALTHLTVLSQTSPDDLLLKNYRPRSIFKIPQTYIEKGRFPVIDAHTHAYATNEAEVAKWVQIMDQTGLEKCIVLSGATGTRFDKLAALYGNHPSRFDMWCGFDLKGFDQPGFGEAALKELERCKQAGARGVGELSDKGRGLAPGLHVDDARMDPILEKCADLGLPINIHVGEDQWMYEKMDEHNDGLMNASKWKIAEAPGVLGHAEVLMTLENAVKKHPRVTFIACHFANCCADLNRLGGMLDKYANLNADIGARFAEIAPIPRFMQKFFDRYQDRLLYGTDNSFNAGMYRTSFRILESEDEHFYPEYFSKYHWPHHGFALTDGILKKLYRENALRLANVKSAQ
jgi:predicted TIM-barrel fold metal-dependent hydrolase